MSFAFLRRRSKRLLLAFSHWRPFSVCFQRNLATRLQTRHTLKPRGWKYVFSGVSS